MKNEYVISGQDLYQARHREDNPKVFKIALGLTAITVLIGISVVLVLAY
ncbi:hypothetical protein LCGC14_2022160 [marine sediment metagenome]|uniref:Uncharacterized protein n=1 Tax=marine sediment metagenome TaxID=412755 RepID=A0A0F9FJN7_9ZZZZ